MAEEQKVQIPRVKLGTHGFEVPTLSGFFFFFFFLIKVFLLHMVELNTTTINFSRA